MVWSHDDDIAIFGLVFIGNDSSMKNKRIKEWDLTLYYCTFAICLIYLCIEQNYIGITEYTFFLFLLFLFWCASLTGWR